MAKTGRMSQIQFLQDNRYKSIGFGVFTILVVLILVSGAITPSISTVIRVRREITEKTSILEDLEAKVSALSSLSQEYDELEYIIEDLPLVYPNTGDYSLITANIEAIIKEHGFSINAIAYQDDKSDESEDLLLVLLPQPVSLSVAGPSVNFVPLLKAFELMPMRPEVSRVSYTNTPDSQGNNNYSILLMMYRIDDILFYE